MHFFPKLSLGFGCVLMMYKSYVYIFLRYIFLRPTVNIKNYSHRPYSIVCPPFDIRLAVSDHPLLIARLVGYIAKLLAVCAGCRSRSLKENAVHPLHAENVINRTAVSLRGLTKRQCKERKSLHIRRNKQTDGRTEGQSANRTSKGTMLGMCALLFVTFSLNLSCE